MKTFLILEDEPLIAMDLTIAVEDAGHRCVTALNNAEALTILGSHDIAAAIIDVNLGRDETCAPSAKELSARSIPFLLHTGDLDRVGESLRAFKAPLVPKPSPSEVVVDQLLGLLGQAV